MKKFQKKSSVSRWIIIHKETGRICHAICGLFNPLPMVDRLTGQHHPATIYLSSGASPINLHGSPVLTITNACIALVQAV